MYGVKWRQVIVSITVGALLSLTLIAGIRLSYLCENGGCFDYSLEYLPLDVFCLFILLVFIVVPVSFITASEDENED